MKRISLLLFTVLISIPAPCLYAQRQAVLLEYRQVPGFWNRVVELPGYRYPKEEKNEANFSVVGTVFHTDTLMGTENHLNLWRLEGSPDSTAASLDLLDRWTLTLDTLCDWKLMRPQSGGTYGALPVCAITLTNRSTQPQLLALNDKDQLPLECRIVYDDKPSTTLSRHPPPPRSVSRVSVPPGGTVITLFHPIQAGPDGSMTSNYHQLSLVIAGQTLATTAPFLAYW